MCALRYLLLGILLFFCQNASGQAERRPAYTVGGGVFRGFVLKHSASIGHLAVSHPQGFQVFVNRHTFGKKYCQQAYRYPDVGLALTYFDYRNPVLGKSLSLASYLDIPIRRRSRAEVMFRLGTGLAYHTNPHDAVTNNSNIALGTPITFTMLGSIRYQFRISEQWWSGVALSLTHFSNGAFSKPNTGINIPTLDWQIARKIKPVAVEQRVWDDDKPNYSGIFYYAAAGTGFKVLEYGGDRFAFVNFHFLAAKRLHVLSALHVGVDAFLDYQLKDYIRQQAGDAYAGYQRIGLVVGHELFYDRLSLLTQVGRYVYRPDKGSRPPVYQQYGLRYACTRHLGASMTLNAHLGQAEFVEWGIGFKF